MIEIDNIEEVLKDMREEAEQNPNQPFRVETVKLGDEAPTQRQILESCLADAERYENVIVIRFSVSKKDDNDHKGCRATGDTRMAIHGPHAAIHGVELIEETVRALKDKIMETFLLDLLREHLGRQSLEKSEE
jgi:hypothetical protein